MSISIKNYVLYKKLFYSLKKMKKTLDKTKESGYNNRVKESSWQGEPCLCGVSTAVKAARFISKRRDFYGAWQTGLVSVP